MSGTVEAAAISKVGKAGEVSEPVLQFAVWRSLSYVPRMAMTVLLAGTGLALQAHHAEVMPGALFLIAAVLLSWVVGFDNKLDMRAFHHDAAWETVPFSRIDEISDLDARIRRWDKSAIDVSSGLGAFLFAVAMAAIAAGAVWAWDTYYGNTGVIVAVDLGILFLPQWFSGIRRVFRQPDLLIKVDHARETIAKVKDRIDQHGELNAQLQMSGKDEARVPTDLRLTVRFTDTPDGFYGLQAQIVLNRVQGTPFPYLYAVVVTRAGEGLFERAKTVDIPRGILLELKTQDDADIAIIRRNTKLAKGYHTKPAMSAWILDTALRVADAQIKGVTD